jgi:hypothetical protein
MSALTAAAVAGPRVVSDPTTVTQVTHCAWYLDAKPRELVVAPKDAGGRPYCELDVATVSNGAHRVAAAFVVQDAIWGEQEGPKSDPFDFVRPAAPTSAPSALRLEP